MYCKGNMCSWQNMGWGKAQENCKMKKRKPLFSYKLILSCFSEVITVNKFREHRKQFNIRHPVSLKKKKRSFRVFQLGHLSLHCSSFSPSAFLPGRVSLPFISIFPLLSGLLSCFHTQGNLGSLGLPSPPPRSCLVS